MTGESDISGLTPFEQVLIAELRNIRNAITNLGALRPTSQGQDQPEHSGTINGKEPPMKLSTNGDWKENKWGEWIFANSNPPLLAAIKAAPEHKIILNGMQYKLSAGRDGAEFINRSRVK